MSKKTIKISILIILILTTFILYLNKDFLFPYEDGKREPITFSQIDTEYLSQPVKSNRIDIVSYTDYSQSKSIPTESIGSFFSILSDNKNKIFEEPTPNTFKVYIQFQKQSRLSFQHEFEPLYNGKKCTIYIDNSLFTEINALGHDGPGTID